MFEESHCAPKRRKCAVTTRETILEAARARFLGDSYDSVGMRDIARDAGVDVALVSRYFGSKEELFRLVLTGGEDKAFELPADPDALPGFFLSLATEGDGVECMDERGRLMIMLRSANSPAAAKVIQAAFRKDVLEPLTGVITGPDAEARAVLAMAILIGINFLQTVMPVEAMAQGEQCPFEPELLRLFETALAPRR